MIDLRLHHVEIDMLATLIRSAARRLLRKEQLLSVRSNFR